MQAAMTRMVQEVQVVAADVAFAGARMAALCMVGAAAVIFGAVTAFLVVVSMVFGANGGLNIAVVAADAAVKMP